MARRRIQEVLATDPKYSGVFIADAKPATRLAPTIQPMPPLENREAQGTEQAPEPHSAGSEEGRPVETLKAAEVEPIPAPAPAGAAKREQPVRGQAKAQVSVRLRPLASQTERLEATGLKPKQVMKAALRKAMEGFTVGPDYIEPTKDARAAGSTYIFDTTLTVDAEALTKLGQKHDPLGVEGQYYLMRGQIEPAFWAALDDLLTQLAKPNQT